MRRAVACLLLLVSHAASSGLRRRAFYLSRRLSRGPEELETSDRPAGSSACIAHRSEAKKCAEEARCGVCEVDGLLRGTARHYCGQRKRLARRRRCRRVRAPD